MLLQALTGGHRTWVGAPPGSKTLGQVMDEMARMEAGLLMDDPLQQLELREHSLALRAQKFGIWSDSVRAYCGVAVPSMRNATIRFCAKPWSIRFSTRAVYCFHCFCCRITRQMQVT